MSSSLQKVMAFLTSQKSNLREQKRKREALIVLRLSLVLRLLMKRGRDSANQQLQRTQQILPQWRQGELCQRSDLSSRVRMALMALKYSWNWSEVDVQRVVQDESELAVQNRLRVELGPGKLFPPKIPHQILKLQLHMLQQLAFAFQAKMLLLEERLIHSQLQQLLPMVVPDQLPQLILSLQSQEQLSSLASQLLSVYQSYLRAKQPKTAKNSISSCFSDRQNKVRQSVETLIAGSECLVKLNSKSLKNDQEGKLKGYGKRFLSLSTCLNFVKFQSSKNHYLKVPLQKVRRLQEVKSKACQQYFKILLVWEGDSTQVLFKDKQRGQQILQSLLTVTKEREVLQRTRVFIRADQNIDLGGL